MTAVLHLTGAALILAVIWAGRAWFHPFTTCRWCSGSGKNPGSSGRRWGRCKRCKGSGNRQVLGSKQVHTIVRSVVAARSKRSSR